MQYDRCALDLVASAIHAVLAHTTYTTRRRGPARMVVVNEGRAIERLAAWTAFTLPFEQPQEVRLAQPVVRPDHSPPQRFQVRPVTHRVQPQCIGALAIGRIGRIALSLHALPLYALLRSFPRQRIGIVLPVQMTAFPGCGAGSMHGSRVAARRFKIS